MSIPFFKTICLCGVLGLQVVTGAGAQVSEHDSITSPTIMRFVEGVRRGDPGAENHFWSTMSALGTPMVEVVPGDSGIRLVTFLYRGDSSTSAAVVVSLQNDQLANDAYYGLAHLHHIGATSVWYRTYRLPGDARFSYRIGADVDQKTRAHLSDAAWQQKLSRLGPDPLNAKQTPGPSGPESVVELPAAPPQRWLASARDARHGALDSMRIGVRLIQVYVPPTTHRRAPTSLLVILDGDEVPDTFPATTVLDQLIGAGRVGPTIAIMIGNAPEARVHDLWYSEEFVRLIRDTIIPAVRRRHALPRCPARCAIAGRSLGGSAALFVAFRSPALFGGVIAQSGGFMYPRRPDEWNSPQAPDALMERGFSEKEWLTGEIARAPLHQLRVYLEAGRFEDVTYQAREVPAYAAGNVLTSSRHLRDVLVAKGYTLRYHEYNGNHRVLNWRGTFGDAVIFMQAHR